MAMKKKKAVKKKKASKKKAVKKPSPKKKTSPKKTATKTKPKKLKANAGKILIDVTQGGKVDGGPKSVWSITLKGLNGDSIPAGLITAKNKTEAMKRARRVLKAI